MVIVHAANIHNRDGAKLVLEQLRVKEHSLEQLFGLMLLIQVSWLIGPILFVVGCLK